MQKRVFIIGLISGLISCYNAECQNNESVDKWTEYVEELAEDLEEEDEEQIESLYADLSYLSEHPMNLNTVSAEALRRLTFLSDAQIDAILAYRKKNGALLTVFELKNIEALDRPTIDLMLPFVYVGEMSAPRRSLNARNLYRYGSNELVLRYDRTLEQKQGYRSQPDSVLQQSPNRKYLGEPFYHSLRYSYTFDDRVQAGLVAEKDAGEPFGNKHHKGYDYYSAHVLLRDMGWLKTLALGDYKASFGQGLVLSHDFSPGRNAVLSQAERRNNGFRRHYSTNEQDFFRGCAAAIRWQDLDVSLFYSHRKLDATVDSTGTITSFKTDGLHRLVSERDKMRTATMQTFGGNVRYAAPNYHFGLTVLTYSFGDLSVEPSLQAYNRYYFRGSRNVNASADYMFKIRKIKIFGETAISKNGAWATLNALQWSPASYANGLILYRNYARDYQSYFGNAFAQGSTVQNEEGLYVGLQLTPIAFWKFSGYADLFRYPWLKYGVDAPSSGVEYMAQVDYSGLKQATIYLRYRYRQRESNRTLDGHPEVDVLPVNQHRLRGQMLYNLAAEWSLKTAADASLYFEDEGRASRGWMLSEQASWKPVRHLFQADVYLAYFRTDDYFSRISSYEKNLLYSFSMPSFYGKGTRLSATVRYALARKLTLSAKIGWTHYFEGESIGSGLETIEGKNRVDVYTMIQWKF